MGWDFTITPYDPERWDAIVAASPAELAALLEAAVPVEHRDEDLIEGLNGSGDARDWLRVACRDLAAPEPGAFLGRTLYLERFADAAAKRSPALSAALQSFHRAVEPLLSGDGDAEQTFMRLPPEGTAALARAFRDVDPGLEPRSPEEVARQVIEWEGSGSFEQWALGPFGSLVAWAAERGLGLIVSHDTLPTLRSEFPPVPPSDPAERRLVPPLEWDPPDEPLPAQRGAPALRGRTVAIVLVAVVALLILVAWLQLGRA